MRIYVKVNNTENPAAVNGNPKERTTDGRDTKTITLTMTPAEVAALLPDNTPWSIVHRDMVDVLDEQGNPTGETTEVVNEYGNSEYSLAGDITDHRDGTVSIKMGKPTESELSAATVTALVGQSITPQRAAKLRPVIEAAATSLPDVEAEKAVELFPAWAYPVSYIVGNRVSYGGKLYKCQQAHTSQADWTPDAVPALWVKVSVEEWPEWVQPTGAHDAYNTGDKVTYNGKRYVSLIDANVYSQDAYPAGWEEQT